MWENITTGTIKEGSKLKGKWSTAMFGWSNANCCSGDGEDNIPCTITFITKSNARKFQINNIFFEIWFLRKAMRTIGIAVIPEIISTFLPSKVMSSGTHFIVHNQNKINSMGRRTTWRRARLFKLNEKMNSLPFFRKKRTSNNTMGGITSNRNRGGIELVFK